MPKIKTDPSDYKACEGTGVNSRGKRCDPCGGTGITPDKRAYVKSQGQTRDHHCHWPGCGAQVPPAAWGCKKHWLMLPKHLRAKVWAAFRPGQEVEMTPSREYLDVANEVQQWIKSNEIL